MHSDTLAIRDVVKRRGQTETICGVTLSVDAGERVALLGHNGAGKTTLIRMILGLTRIDGGSISVFGAIPGDAKARRLTAYLPESVAFHAALTGKEQLHLFLKLAGEPVRICNQLLERVGLAGAANRRIGTYSKGMRQRLGLAQVLIGRPQLALLDEPTSGLDPISRHDFYGIVDEMAGNGTAVLVSSHALTELEARTDRIAIMSAGRIVADSSLTELRQQARLPVRLRVTAAGGTTDEVARRLGGDRINCQGVEVFCSSGEKLARLGEIAAMGAIIDDVDVVLPSLEDLYRHFAARGEKS